MTPLDRARLLFHGLYFALDRDRITFQCLYVYQTLTYVVLERTGQTYVPMSLCVSDIDLCCTKEDWTDLRSNVSMGIRH